MYIQKLLSQLIVNNVQFIYSEDNFFLIFSDSYLTHYCYSIRLWRKQKKLVEKREF